MTFWLLVDKFVTRKNDAVKETKIEICQLNSLLLMSYQAYIVATFKQWLLW